MARLRRVGTVVMQPERSWGNVLICGTASHSQLYSRSCAQVLLVRQRRPFPIGPPNWTRVDINECSTEPHTRWN